MVQVVQEHHPGINVMVLWGYINMCIQVVPMALLIKEAPSFNLTRPKAVYLSLVIGIWKDLFDIIHWIDRSKWKAQGTEWRSEKENCRFLQLELELSSEVISK